MAETMREKSSIPTTAGSLGGPQAPSKALLPLYSQGDYLCICLGILSISSVRMRPRTGFRVFSYTHSTPTELSPDAAAGTVFASKRRNGGAGQRPCSTRRSPRDRKSSQDPATHHDGHRNADSPQPAGCSTTRLHRWARWHRIRSGTRNGGSADSDHRTRSATQHSGRSDGSEQEDRRAVDRAATPAPPVQPFEGR